MNAQLILHHLEIPIKLGWTAEERSLAQPMVFCITLQFKTIPEACQSDDLSETICYDTLCQQIQLFSQARSFRLIEHLTFEVFNFIKTLFHKPVSLTVQTMKKPPMKNLEQAFFTLSD